MNDFFNEVIQRYSKTAYLLSASTVSGGCINNTYKLETSEGPLFLKWNSASSMSMFECEKKGLDLLDQHSIISTPKVLSYGQISNKSYLLLEWIEKEPQSSDFWGDFAHNLASQHRVSSPWFGLDHDNFIGSLEQSNKQYSTWHEFFIKERLIPQLKLAESKNLIDKTHLNRFEILFSKLESLVPKESPSLLHGDLWSGNFMCGADGKAVIFDPSIHFGHRETELSFTKLFGGFSSEFYAEYESTFVLEPGFEERLEIHNLYPLLVHVNLFGSSYLSEINQTLKRFT
ncbi:fructosamine kinase family protein [Ekhidna sp.]|uniref:fructosamine kinase family protein n=1 Tax=Ekhidna sp. TaxID=2608089 RepID=UPI0035121710